MPGTNTAALVDGIEALAALEQLGTVGEAAIRLRLTQSAVSKRLSALERSVGYAVVRASGRRLVLTPEGLDLVQRARPLLAELRDLVRPGELAPQATLSVALADSIAASWGPGVVAEALAARPGLRVELHAHRTVLVVESVRLGRYHVGLATDPGPAPDLVVDALGDEPMVLVGPRSGDRPLITIEPRSATWRAVEPRLARHAPELLARELVPVESFSAALRMVEAGFGDGLVPLGLAEGSGSTRIPGVFRSIVAFTRKTVHHSAAYAALKAGVLVAFRAALARAEAR